MSRRKVRRIAAVLSATCLAMLWSTAPVAAVSSSTSATTGGVTQTHTLFYNITQNCYNGFAGYAFLSWNTKWTRPASSIMEVSHSKWRTFVQGGRCGTGAFIERDSGGTFYPHFNGRLSFTWTLQLNWPTIAPPMLAPGAGSVVRSWITRGAGGPFYDTVCTSVVITGSFAGCQLV